MEEVQSKKMTRQTRQSSRENKDKQIDSEMEGTNIGEHITYDVLRMIFEYANIKDLTRAAMVCRSWNEAARQEIQTRIKPQHMVHEFDSIQNRYEVSKTFTDQLVIKPSVGLLFIGKEVREVSCYHPIDYTVCHNILRESNCITVWNYGMVYDDTESEGNVVAGLFLPNIPGVKIKCFTIDRLELAQLRTTTHQRSRAKLARKLFKISPKEENIKSIILFANYAAEEREEREESSQTNDVRLILKAFLSEQTNNKDKISVWGGIASKLMVCSSVLNGDTCQHRVPLAGISICGAGVSTWSKVLDSRVKTKEQAEKELTNFRDGVKLQKYSVGFMFACLGRGKDWYEEKNVEPKIFRKLFPNVPLVGSFGGGEFGLSTVPQECSNRGGIIHEYSTIFLILSYGSIRKMK